VNHNHTTQKETFGAPKVTDGYISIK